MRLTNKYIQLILYKRSIKSPIVTYKLMIKGLVIDFRNVPQF